MKNITINVNDIDFTKTVRYYTKVYGLSENAIRNRFKRLGILHKFTWRRGDNMKLRAIEEAKEYNLNPKFCKECKIKIEYKKKNNNFCSHKCSRIFTVKNSTAEERKMSEKQKRKLSTKLTKHWKDHPVPKVKLLCKFCHNEFKVYNHAKNKRKFCSKKCFQKGKDTSNCGGFRGNAGNRGKYGWYKGYYCQSSWELAWVIYSLDHNVKFERNTKGFEYFFQDKSHKFYPDFYLPELETYLEIKGMIKDDDIEKIKQFQGKLIVLFKKEITPILQYVIQKYGNNFIELYDGNPHRAKKNKCLLCGAPARFQYCSRKCGCKSAQKIYIKECHANSSR